MPHFISFDPDTELIGRTAYAVLKSIRREEFAAILAKHGMDKIDPNQWYPLQNVLNVMNDIEEASDASTNFVSIGMAAAQLGVDHLPPEIRDMTLEQWVMSYPAAWQMAYRGGDAGGFEVQKVDDDHYILTARVPYPDDVFYGVIFGYVRHFCPKDRRFSLRYDATTPRRDEGGEVTIVHLQLT